MTMETTYEEEAEEMAKTAEKLAKQHKRDRQIPREEGVYQLPVVGAEVDDEEETITFTVLLGSEEKREVTVSYPDDTEDMDEPLVRLLEWKDVSFQSFAHIGEIPVYTDGGDDRYELCVPTKDALNTVTVSNKRLSTYKIEGRRDVLMTQRPLFWLLIGLSSIGIGGLIFMLLGSVQEMVQVSLFSANAGLLILFSFLMLIGFRSLWRSLEVKY